MSDETNVNPTNDSQDEPKGLSIREAARTLDISEQYVRQLIIGEKLQAEKNADGHWVISQEAVDDYAANHADNKKVGYIVYLDDETLEVLKASFPTLEFTKRFDAEKAKAYRMRRAAK